MLVIEKSSRVKFSSLFFLQVKDLRDHQLDNRMESFFLAETIKYLYLLFDPTHFLHGGGTEGDGSWEEGGEAGECVLGAGGFIFNTEAHPLDPAALYCCGRHDQDRQELQDILLTLSQPGSQSKPPPKQTEGGSQSESIALKPGEKKTPPLLSCPVQPFSARLSILGQVFTDDTWDCSTSSERLAVSDWVRPESQQLSENRVLRFPFPKLTFLHRSAGVRFLLLWRSSGPELCCALSTQM